MGNKVTFFTKLRGLATVIWDGENDRPMVEFNREGLFCTKDPNLAKQLNDMGYLEVSTEEITQAGLTLPNIPDKDKGPGKGYTNEPGGPPEGMPSEISGESPMEAYLKGSKKKGEGAAAKGRTIVQ